jgi:hypothetical protein
MFNSIRECTPKPVLLQNLAKRVDFEIDRPRAFALAQPLPLKVCNVLLADIADQSASELFDQLRNEVLIGRGCLSGRMGLLNESSWEHLGQTLMR